MDDQTNATAVETYPANGWWRNRVGTAVLAGKYADRASAVQHGARVAKARGLDHVVTFTGSTRRRPQARRDAWAADVVELRPARDDGLTPSG